MSSARHAVRFSRDERVKDLTHREVLGLWERVLVESGLALAPSDARSRHPRFALAAPLPPGYASECEWVEVYFSGPVSPSDVVDALNARLPAGFAALEEEVLEDSSPSLQSRLRWAEYRFCFSSVSPSDMDAAITAFFERGSFPWQEDIEGKTKHFDLRALTDDLWVERNEGDAALCARLDASTNGTGRPDSVLAGLGLGEPCAKHRTALVFSHLPATILLWRRSGRFESSRPER